MFRLTKRTLSAAAVIAALSAPSTAFARFDLDPVAAPTPTHQQGQGNTSWQQIELQAYQRSVAKSFGTAPGGLEGPVARAHAVGVNPVRPAQGSSQEGFQWDDAGIGAAGILALLGLGAGTATAITRRRTHQTSLS